jgi:hypothetical protein
MCESATVLPRNVGTDIEEEEVMPADSVFTSTIWRRV